MCTRSSGAFKGSLQQQFPGFVTTVRKLIGKRIFRPTRNASCWRMTGWMSKISRVGGWVLTPPQQFPLRKFWAKCRKTCFHSRTYWFQSGCFLFQCKCGCECSNLHVRSGDQQHDVPALVVGEHSHSLPSVLNVLAINLKTTRKRDQWTGMEVIPNTT